MKHQTVIVSNWQQATAQAQEQQRKQQEQRTAEKRHYWQEFRESLCDLFDWADFEFYSEKTGVKVESLRRLARYSTDPDYRRPARDIDLRYQFWKDNGHSITKPYKWD